MTVQTSYTMYTPDGLEGMLYGLVQTNTKRQTYTNVSGDFVSYGRAVQLADTTLYGDRAATTGMDAAADGDTQAILGVTMRQSAYEATTRPSTGVSGYPNQIEMGILEDGPIYVKLVSGSALPGGDVYVNRTTGEFAAAAAAGYSKASNAKFQSTGTTGEIVVLAVQSDNLQPKVSA